jgi:CDP-diacylglycerol---serine O-phosphatidyltransferase
MNDIADDSRRGMVYLLPNLFTTAGLFSGYYSIVASINGHFGHAAVAILIAAFFDGIDGRVARLTKTQSEFGVQYDSLSDLISFGLAPSLLMYTWSLETLRTVSVFAGKIGWLVAFLYTACAALRLARFNVQVGVIDKRFFQGLASPAAAATIVATVLAAEEYGFTGFQLRFVTPFLTTIVALLMVSKLRYFSFKSWPEKVPFYWLGLFVGLLIFLAINPAYAALTIATMYLLSGPLLAVILARKRPPVAAEKSGQ